MTWEIVGPLAGGLAAVFTLIGIIATRIWDRAAGEGQSAAHLSDAAVTAAAAVGQIKLLANEFSEYKERNGRDIAKLEGRYEALDALNGRMQADIKDRVTAAEERMTQAMNGMRDELRDIRKDLTRALERRGVGPVEAH